MKTEKKKERKFYKGIMLIVFFALLIAFPVLTFITMPSEPAPFSENENRYLTVFPKLTFESFQDETFMQGYEKWFSDRFFGREDLIRLKNTTQRLLGRTDINGVFTGNDRMIEIWEGYDEDFISKNLNAIKKFAKKYSDKPVYFLLAPTSQEIYASTMPASAPLGSQSSMLEFCREQLGNSVNVINVMSELKKHSDEYICYRTDHHWTSLGAYYAYYEAANAMGFKPSDISSFDIEHASSDFRGTLYSKTLDNSVTPDVIDYYHPKDGEHIKLTVNDGSKVTKHDSLYFREYLDVKDKYSSFTGQNVPSVTIETGVEGPSLLLIKDSYAHSLVPFLTAHYSKITMVDLRYARAGLSIFAKPQKYDSIMFLYNAITFSSDSYVRTLNME